MIPLTKEEKKIHRRSYICKKRFSTHDNNKKHHKEKDHCRYAGTYRGAAHDVCNLRDNIPKEIPLVFHNGSTYDYHFIIKVLAEEFKGQFECLRENTEKYITFSVPIRKELNSVKLITYKVKFIDSFRFMSTNHIFLKTFNSEFQEIVVWFTDQPSKNLPVENRMNLTLIIK